VIIVVPKWYELVCNGVTFGGVTIIASGYPVSGFTVSIIGNIMWIIYGKMTKQIGFILSNIGFLIVGGYGIWNWTR
jgi:hypothetical protein